MNNESNPAEQPNRKEIMELREELNHDKQVRDQAEQIVREEDVSIERLEKKIDELEHPKVELFVNGERKEWKKPEISYREVVVLAFGTYEDKDDVTYSVDYTHGPDGNREGILNKGQSVPVTNKMRFRVQKTNRS
jgi:hypothetical protein